MLGWAVTFLIIALVAALFGFGGIAGTAVEIAKLIFFVAIVLFAISAVIGLLRGRSPDVMPLRHSVKKRRLARAAFFVEIVLLTKGQGAPESYPCSAARVMLSGPRSSISSTFRREARRKRARLTRLLMVPTAQPQICAVSS